MEALEKQGDFYTGYVKEPGLSSVVGAQYLAPLATYAPTPNWQSPSALLNKSNTRPPPRRWKFVWKYNEDEFERKNIVERENTLPVGRSVCGLLSRHRFVYIIKHYMLFPFFVNYKINVVVWDFQTLSLKCGAYFLVFVHVISKH